MSGRTGSSLKSKNANIIVAVRVRPSSERERGLSNIIRVVDDRLLLFDPPGARDAHRKGVPSHQRRARNIKLAFDRVFDQYATQIEVYNDTAKRVIEDVLDGYNGTVFAYGATESGPGVMVQAMRDMYQTIEQKVDKTFKIKLGYMEVYNEQLRDLLWEPKRDERGEKLPGQIEPIIEMRELNNVVQVSNVSFHSPETPEELFALLERGNLNRSQSPTDANASSSRSHAILQIEVSHKDRASGVTTEWKNGKLSLIDLAGSERASVTKNRGNRMVEGANINRSLLALGNCINALGEGYTKGKYVPYRDSKLTRLLKDSLGGNCKTVMIANISPSSSSYDDTYNTLKYANRAKNIRTKVSCNVVKVDEHIDRYRNVIATLETEVAGLRRQLKNANPNSTYEEDQQKVDKYALEIQDVGHKKIRSKHSLLAVKQEKQDLIRKVAVRMRMMQNAERNGKSKEDRTAQIRQEITVIEANMANVDKKEQILFAKTETFTKELHRIRSKICQETFCQDKKLLLEREFERIQFQIEKDELQWQANIVEKHRTDSQSRIKQLEDFNIKLVEVVERQQHYLIANQVSFDETLRQLLNSVLLEVTKFPKSPCASPSRNAKAFGFEPYSSREEMSNTDASVCFSISSPNQSNVVEQRTPSSEKKNRSRNSRRSPQSQLNSNESKENGNSGSGKRKQRFRRVESPLKGKLNFPSNAHSNGDKTSYNNINNCINNDINNDDIDNENAITTIINETHSNDAQPLVAIENKIQSAADLTKWNRPQQQVRNFHAPQLPSKMHENTSKDIDSVEILARDQENESVRPSGTATVKALPQSTSLVGLRQAFAAVRNNHSLCNLSSQSANVIE